MKSKLTVLTVLTVALLLAATFLAAPSTAQPSRIIQPRGGLYFQDMAGAAALCGLWMKPRGVIDWSMDPILTFHPSVREVSREQILAAGVVDGITTSTWYDATLRCQSAIDVGGTWTPDNTRHPLELYLLPEGTELADPVKVFPSPWALTSSTGLDMLSHRPGVEVIAGHWRDFVPSNAVDGNLGSGWMTDILNPPDCDEPDPRVGNIPDYTQCPMLELIAPAGETWEVHQVKQLGFKGLNSWCCGDSSSAVVELMCGGDVCAIGVMNNYYPDFTGFGQFDPPVAGVDGIKFWFAGPVGAHPQQVRTGVTEILALGSVITAMQDGQ